MTAPTAPTTTGARHRTAAPVATGPVSARRILLPDGDPVDPWDLVGDDGMLVAADGRVLVGLGSALRLELPAGVADAHGVAAAEAALAAVPCDDRLATGTTPLRGVLALGSLPFDREAPARLTVPALLFCREPDGTEWVTVTRSDGAPVGDPAQLRVQLLARASTAHRDGGPTDVRITPRTSDREFEDRVARAVDAIGRHEAAKVVLARQVVVALDRAPDVADVLRRWATLEPSCTLFSLPTTDGRFVGASPELLVERAGSRVSSRPLAGTTDRVHGTDSSLPTALLESAKDAEEHRFVVDAVREVLAPWSDDLQVPDGPELVHLHNLTHLGTTIEGSLRTGPTGSVPGALALVALLHPTPAVGGVPRDAALGLIRRLEDGSRGHYAGPVGWIDGTGDGRFVVGIRAMTVIDRTVALTAGVGIVAGSRPEVELRETGLKFRAVFDALAPGVPFDTSTPPPPDGNPVSG